MQVLLKIIMPDENLGGVCHSSPALSPLVEMVGEPTALQPAAPKNVENGPVLVWLSATPGDSPNQTHRRRIIQYIQLQLGIALILPTFLFEHRFFFVPAI